MATLEQFMTAISGQESGGDYDIVNQNSGAHGRFQIMPENWPSWSQEAGLGPNAPKTARNQDIVAAFKMQQYYNQYGNWADVASVWYSGRPLSALSDEQRYGKNYTEGVEYPSIQEYTDSIMGRLGEEGQTSAMSEQLPFSQQDYQTKLARFLYLERQYESHDPLLKGPFDPALLNELATLEAEVSEYERIRDQGGANVGDDITRANYNNANSKDAIDAENSANAWARQQKINEQALSKTSQDMGEQRLTADSANRETAEYRGSNHFNAPMGFRVGATNLPTEEELFKKNIDKAAKDLPAVKPIPYSQQLPAPGAASRTATPPVADAYHKSLTLDTWPDVKAESDTLPPIGQPQQWSRIPIGETASALPPASSAPTFSLAPTPAALGPRASARDAIDLHRRSWNPSILRGRR